MVLALLNYCLNLPPILHFGRFSTLKVFQSREMGGCYIDPDQTMIQNYQTSSDAEAS